jgi:Zn-dependent peptidase ImmA (M78 family)
MSGKNVATIEQKKMSAEGIEQRAAEILRQHGLFSVPVDPVILAHREGIKVFNAVFSDSGISGMVAKRGSDVTFYISQNEVPYRKRFTIAHELAHHFLHLISDGEFVDTQVDLFRDSESAPGNQQAEIEANRFAAALLMPADLVREAYKTTRDVAALAREFNVSEEAMGIRLARLGLA